MVKSPETLTQAFDFSTKAFRERTVFEYRRRDRWKGLAYEGLRKAVGLASGILVKEGMVKDDRAALLLDTSPEWSVFYFGIIFSGAVCVPLDPKTPERELANILKDAGCSFLITDRNGQARLREAKNTSFEGLKKIIITDDLEILEGEAGPEYATLPDIDIKPDDTASILYTSGTTDKPKGVVLSHASFMANFRSIEDAGLISASDSVSSALPLYHSYAFMITLVVPLFAGGRIVYPESPTSESILQCISDREITVFVAVPQILYLMHGRIWQEINKLPFFKRLLLYKAMGLLWFIRRITGINLARRIFVRAHRRFGRRFRFFVSGGARLDPDKELDFFKLGFTILEGYGLTETSPVVTFNTPRSYNIGSVGKPVKGVEVKIDRPDDTGVGEVLIKGSNVMKGYYRRDDETAAAMKGGWFHSGDLGYLKNGFLYLAGRSKEVIVLSSGKNIYPEELEAHYMSSPFVKEICLMGASQIKHDTSSDGLYAVVVADIEHFKKAGETDLERVIQGKLENLSRDMPGYKRILGLVITKKELPRTRLGKIKRYEVLSAYRDVFLGKAGEARKEAALDDRDRGLLATDTGKRVLRCISLETGIKRDIYPGESLELSLGIDSLLRVEIISALEREFRVEIPASFAAEVFYVRDVINGIDDILKKAEAAPAAAGKKALTEEEFWPAVLQEGPSAEIKERIEIDPGLFSRCVTFFFSSVFYVFFRIFHNLKVYGAENIPRDERPLIMCANHTSYYDAFLIVFSAPFSVKMRLFFFGFKGYFSVPVMRDLVKMMRVIPIDTAEEVMSGMQSASYVLRHKRMLVIFPEGQRSFDGKLKEFKKGVGILARELGVDILPVSIEGAYRAWPRTDAFPAFFRPITVRYEKPVDAGALAAAAPEGAYQDEYEKIASGLHKKMSE